MAARQFALTLRSAAAALTLCAAGGVAAAPSWLQRAEPAGEVLAVDEALRPLPVLWDDGRLLVGIEAAPGVYLYRDKLRVEVIDPPGYPLGPVALPAGDPHRDEHFGEVRVLRGTAQAQFRPAAERPPRRIRLHYQGCAEDRVCYPPQTRQLDVMSVR